MNRKTLEPYQCKLCGYTTKKKGNMIQHFNRKKPCTREPDKKLDNDMKQRILNRQHQDNNSRYVYTCNACNFETVDKSKIKNHFKTKKCTLSLAEKNRVLSRDTKFRLNNFGKEKRDYVVKALAIHIKSKDISKSIEIIKIIPDRYLVSIIMMIHSHGDYPENHNIVYGQCNDINAEVFVDGTFVLMQRMKVYERLQRAVLEVLEDAALLCNDRGFISGLQTDEFVDAVYDIFYNDSLFKKELKYTLKSITRNHRYNGNLFSLMD